MAGVWHFAIHLPSLCGVLCRDSVFNGIIFLMISGRFWPKMLILTAAMFSTLSMRSASGHRRNLCAFWPILLDHWLTYYAIHAARVALALRNHHLGDPSVIDDVSYLHTCRNTRRLREVVLREFIDFGEHPAHIEFSTSNRSLKPQSEGTSVQSNAEVSPVDVLRRHVYLLIQTHFPKNHTTRTADGSVLMAYGSSVLCVSIASDPITVRVSANLLTQVVPTAQLYETLNHINHELPLGRMYAVNNLVVLEASIPPIAIEEKMLLYTIANLAHIADIYDDRLQRSFGGDVSGIAVAGDVIDV